MKKILICPFCGEIIKRDMEECARCGATREFCEREIEKRKRNKDAEIFHENIKIEDNFNQNIKDSELKENKTIVESNEANLSQDIDGKIEVKTNDVTLIPRSMKEARGDMPKKPKWWDVPKHAENILVRRKIMKEVNKAGRDYPEKVKKWKMILLCVLFGYFGLHNFYEKDYKKGLIHLILFVVSIVIANLPWEFMKTTGLDWAVGGLCGFICIFWWFLDIFNLVFNKYVFKQSKDKFISKLNFNTRSKLGKKYINGNAKTK